MLSEDYGRMQSTAPGVRERNQPAVGSQHPHGPAGARTSQNWEGGWLLFDPAARAGGYGAWTGRSTSTASPATNPLA